MSAWWRQLLEAANSESLGTRTDTLKRELQTRSASVFNPRPWSEPSCDPSTRNFIRVWSLRFSVCASSNFRTGCFQKVPATTRSFRYARHPIPCRNPESGICTTFRVLFRVLALPNNRARSKTAIPPTFSHTHDGPGYDAHN